MKEGEIVPQGRLSKKKEYTPLPNLLAVMTIKRRSGNVIEFCSPLDLDRVLYYILPLDWNPATDDKFDSLTQVKDSYRVKIDSFDVIIKDGENVRDAVERSLYATFKSERFDGTGYAYAFNMTIIPEDTEGGKKFKATLFEREPQQLSIPISPTPKILPQQPGV